MGHGGGEATLNTASVCICVCACVFVYVCLHVCMCVYVHAFICCYKYRCDDNSVQLLDMGNSIPTKKHNQMVINLY